MRLNLPDTDILISESRDCHADGRSVVLESKSAPHLTYHLLLPRERHPDGRVLVSIHGVSRNAEEHIELLRPLADRHGVLLVAPVFAADRFRDFQRLGRKGRGPRADLALIRLLNELSIATGWDTSKIDMFGFSGGAQFVHRFALAHPQRVRRLALGAAGWYTMPDDTLSYPYGTADAAGLDAVRLNTVAAARLPTLVLVGERDDRADDEELNRSQMICGSQGDTRLRRAQNWTRAMNSFAASRGEPEQVSMLTLPGVDHSFRDAVIEGGLAAHVFRHCYEAPAPTRRRLPSDTESANSYTGCRVSPFNMEPSTNHE
jgi:pimeloyl-ACP methyl ester carboxylesterase